MKTITRSRIYLALVAMILTAAVTIPAAAQTQVAPHLFLFNMLANE